MKMYRQGDVLIMEVKKKKKVGKCTEVPRDNGRIVLAYGEVTGHAHAITSPHAGLLATKALTAWGTESNVEERYLTVKKTVVLEHEEHAPITIKKGVYKVVRQREYDPIRDRYVAD